VLRIGLGPRTMTRYSVRELVQKAGLAGTYGGFKIVLKSRVGSLDTAYLLFDETVGFSALMKTFDRGPQGKIEQRIGFPPVAEWTTRAPMLALTNPDAALGFPSGTVLQPQIFVRNTTAAPVTAGLRFNWRSDARAGTSPSSPLRLAPYETRRVDVAILQKNQVIPAEAHWASVELAISGQPNDVMAVAASYDTTLRYGTQTPFNDQLTFHWEGGEWRVDATHNSIITAGNGGKVPIKAQFTIYYDSGKKRYDLEQALQPHGQMFVDVGKLIRQRMPDKNGSVLPPDLMMGSYEIQDLTDRGVGNLYEGKVIVDKTYGHVAYGCAQCCGYGIDPWMYWDPILTATGAEADQDVWDMNNCTSSDVSVLDYFPDWGTGNHAIATASGHVIKGVAPGSTTNFASGTLTVGGASSYKCLATPLQPSGPANVEPVPSGEITAFEDTYQISAAQFLMTLEPTTPNYDGHSVTESSPVIGVNACWWSSSGMAQYPTVQGSTWTVASGNAGHNQYGFDTVGYGSGVVNLIQTQGPAHGVEFPCTINIHQSINYDGIDLYVTNLLSQTVGSNTVQVCRAGVCSGSIPY
jgi:hypothetical protein